MATSNMKQANLQPHALPPSDFASKRIAISVYRTSWYRIYRTAYGPVFFGRTGMSRFDAPGGEYGVLYVAEDECCAFIETFGHETGRNYVDQGELAARALAVVTPGKPIRLADFTAEGLARMGADARLTMGESLDVAQQWSLAVHEHPEKPDGIAYRSRHDPSRICAALFEHVGPKLKVKTLGPLGERRNASLVRTLLDTYQFDIV